jgi:uncharacterized membrane protein
LESTGESNNGLWAGVTKDCSIQAELGSSDTDVSSLETNESSSFITSSDVVIVSTVNGTLLIFSNTMIEMAGHYCIIVFDLAARLVSPFSYFQIEYFIKRSYTEIYNKLGVSSKQASEPSS